MSAERHARVKALFHAALERPRDEREAVVTAGCAGDQALAREVREMLAAEESAGAFLEPISVGLGLLLGTASAEQLGQLGRFRVLRLLGEGGMGAVYEAEQDRPRRRVALKVLHPGHATPQMLRRFELEGEMLGRLEHPGIARIYEVGASDTGRGPQPWLAMELVVGDTLTEHCARHALPLTARLELLARVADAVQHAHQRGIVHRDLKPANVLVDASGQPKVLDFGIARATDADLQLATLRTDPGMIVGTLQYMSPEQAAADPDAVDVRTDVYSLGVILYELAAGRPPFDLRRLPMHEALRCVLEMEPQPLRTATRRVPADVAVMAHKALAKDKERRYDSAAELAADLRRYLRHEPILAQPPSRAYRLRRFARRHKALAGGMAATFAALVIGLALAVWQRNEAREALARAEGINRFLLGDLLASPSPERLGREVRVVDVLGPAARSAERTFASQPRVAAEVLDAVAASYRALGLVPEAERTVRRALALLGEDATDRLALRARGHLVGVLTDLDRAEEAAALGATVVADSARRLGRDDAETLGHRSSLAVARWNLGQHAASLEELRAVAQAQARILGADDPRTLATHSQLAVNLASSGAIAEARDLLATTLARQQEVLGPEHPGTLGSQTYLAWILTLSSAWQEAEVLYAQLLPALEGVYGADHPYTALARVDLAQCPMHLGRIDEAEVLVRTACEDLERRLGPEHGSTLRAYLMLAEVHFRKGEHAEAAAQAQRVVDHRRATGVTGEDLGHALAKLGRCHQEAGDQQAAAAAFHEAAQVFRAAFPEPTDYLAQMLYNLGVATRDGGDPAAAITPMEEALAIDIQVWGPGHRHVVSDRYNLARTLLAAGRPADALPHLRAALTAAADLNLEPWRMLSYRAVLGEALAELEQDEEAERYLLAAAEGLAALDRADDSTARRARAVLVRLYERQGRTLEAALHR